MVRFPPGPLPQLMGWTEIFFGGLIVIRLGIFSLAVTGPALAPQAPTYQVFL
jgi:hypothetical protein